MADASQILRCATEWNMTIVAVAKFKHWTKKRGSDAGADDGCYQGNPINTEMSAHCLM